jgi:hypothetical protein
VPVLSQIGFVPRWLVRGAGERAQRGSIEVQAVLTPLSMRHGAWLRWTARDSPRS